MSSDTIPEVPFAGVRKATDAKLGAETKGTLSPADEFHRARLSFDTRRGLQPKAKVETLPPHFER